jgi:arylsulfatase A-like enzyme
MISLFKKIDNTKLSFFQCLRLTFVLFFLYLLGDAIYRWDGFKYYASFSEFIQSLSLATILWGIVSVFSVFILWIPIGITQWLCRYKRMNSLTMLTFIYTIYAFILMSIIAVIVKNYFWFGLTLSFTLKLLLFLLAGFIAVVIAFLIRHRSGVINEHITPLVWLFGIWFILSIPIAAYQYVGNHKVGYEASINAQYSKFDNARPNIILVTFDALRTRDMSVYGYHQETTPFISNWARSASIFTRLEASSTYTTPATASLMTGKRVWTHLTFHNEGSKPDKSYSESLPSLLKKNGYYTAAFIGTKPASVTQLGIDHDFDIAPFASDFITPHSLLGHINKLLYKLFSDKFRLYNWIVKNDFVFYQVLTRVSREVARTAHPSYDVFKRFLLNVDDHHDEPFFAWIHLHPPHDPYLPPEPFMGMFDASLELRTKERQEKLVSGIGHVAVNEETQGIINILRARYDENIRYCDNEFKNFIKELSAKNLLNNTIILLSADHGESFEHNILGHGCSDLFEEVTNIPLIIKVPGNTENKIFGNVVRQIDIPATILDFAGIPVPSWMEGRSVRPLIYGENLISEPAFSMALFNNKVGQQISNGTIAVWEGNYKLIHYLDKNKSLLFNLEKDPYELDNLFDKEPIKGQNLLTLIKDKLSLANRNIEKDLRTGT